GRRGAWQWSLLKLSLTQRGSGRLSRISSPLQTGAKRLTVSRPAWTKVTGRLAGSGAALTTCSSSGAAARVTAARASFVHIRKAPLQPAANHRGDGFANSVGRGLGIRPVFSPDAPAL